MDLPFTGYVIQASLSSSTVIFHAVVRVTP